jgi:hypothetical protein
MIYALRTSPTLHTPCTIGGVAKHWQTATGPIDANKDGCAIHQVKTFRGIDVTQRAQRQ